MEFSGVISPDGKYMVYIITGDNANNLHVMKMATRETKQFTFAPVGKNCTCPRWSPDGKQIFFQGSGFYSRPAVMVRDFTPF
jgi:Tol biopolymer transport system component